MKKYCCGRGERLAEISICKIIKQVIEGLHDMHSIGILHRDIKADNILIREEVIQENADTDFVVSDMVLCIADLGFADEYTISESFKEDIFCGTPGYIDPAVMNCTHNYSPQSDYFSLGALMFNLLVGGGRKSLFNECTGAMMMRNNKKMNPHLIIDATQ